MNNQNPTQVPDPRLDQIMEEMRRMREENKQLRNTVDYMTQQRTPAPAPTTAKKQLFQPQIESALQEFVSDYFKEKFEPLQVQWQNTTNFLADRDDLLMFNSKYGAKEYDAHKEKIEQIRAERARMGQPLTREDAYKFIQVDEYGKKPKLTDAPTTPQAPAWDPYLGRFVEPGQVAKPAATQTPAAPVTPPVQQTINQPTPKQDEFVLPPVGMNQSTKAQPSFSTSRVEVGADEKALEEWAHQYGDEAI